MKRDIKILFADDEKVYSRALPDTLKPRGVNYVFDFVYTVEDAIAQLEYNSFNYDVIIVDLRFKTENLAGLKIFKYLAKKLIDIPSIIITAYANDKNLKECIKQRPYEFLEKPFDFATLKKTIQEVLKKASLNKKTKRPHISTARRILNQVTGQAKVDLLIGGLESLSPDQYETIVSELPMIRTVIQEEEFYKEDPKIDDSWKKTGKIPLPILDIANLSIEYQVRKLVSGEKATYGPFVYIRWMNDGKQEQLYLGKLEKLTDPNVIERLYKKYEKDEEIRKLDKFNSLPLLYKKYCQKK